MTGELARSRRALKRAERLSAWQDVARRVAHEIKNPLTPIQFAIHRLQRRIDAQDDPETAESIDAILGEVDTLRSIADTFSSLAKLPEPTMAPLDVGSLLGEVATLYATPEVRITADIAADLPSTCGDRRQLRQVFNNLIQNALDAMQGVREPSGGDDTLTIRARQAAGRIEIEIADSGPGIDAALTERIWEPYFTTKAHGSGIGLAVVAKIIGDHRGTIDIDNRPEGGALVRVALPIVAPESVAPAAPAASRTAITSHAGLGALLVLLTVWNAALGAAPIAAIPTPPSAPGSPPAPVTPVARDGPPSAERIVATIEPLLPEGWCVAEVADSATVFLWDSDARTIAVQLDDRSLRIHHPKGFTYHQFIRLYVAPAAWAGAMREVDIYGTREPAFLLGDGASCRVLYQSAGMLRWPDALEQLAAALGVTPVGIDRTVHAEIDPRLGARLQQRVMSVASDLRGDVMDRVLGLTQTDAILYVEYVASVAPRPATPGAPPLTAALRELIDGETDRLATHVFHAFPDVEAIYLRRVCDNRMFDRLIDRPSDVTMR